MELFKNAIADEDCSFCKTLPKIELHAHLNGSLSSNTLRTLGCSETSMAKYQELNTILEKTERTLDECFQLFKVAHELTKTKKAVYLATKSVIEEFAGDNVIYLELRTTPREETDMSKEEYIESVVQAILDCQLQIIVKLLCSIDRRHTFEASKESLEIIIKMKNKYPDVIRGLDLSGNPLEGNFPEEIFKTARENGLFVTLHCAEIKNDAEVLKMLQFKPDRLGHCTYLHPTYRGCDLNWQLYCSLKIPIECCMTSNVLCGTSKNYENHHVKELMKENLPYSLNTDDKGVFCTTLSEEYHHAHKSFLLTKEQLLNQSLHSINYSFASKTEKESLKQHLTAWQHTNV